MKDLAIMSALFILGAFLAFPQPASAFYYDPGFGSVMTQVVFAGWLSGLVVIAKLRKRVIHLLVRWFN